MRAAVGRGEPQAHADGGGLAGAVGADHAEAFAGCDLEREVVDHGGCRRSACADGGLGREGSAPRHCGPGRHARPACRISEMQAVEPGLHPLDEGPRARRQQPCVRVDHAGAVSCDVASGGCAINLIQGLCRDRQLRPRLRTTKICRVSFGPCMGRPSICMTNQFIPIVVASEMPAVEVRAGARHGHGDREGSTSTIHQGVALDKLNGDRHENHFLTVGRCLGSIFGGNFFCPEQWRGRPGARQSAPDGPDDPLGTLRGAR